jgi:hypothetical protein
MSYSSLLKHRGDLLDLDQQFVNGVARTEWVAYASGLKCFLDLQYVRFGKDPLWTPEAGRASDRTGVLFLLGKPGLNVEVRSGMRFKTTKGPAGTFLIEGAVDEVWRPTAKHHIEVGVTEVPSQISKGKGPK